MDSFDGENYTKRQKDTRNMWSMKQWIKYAAFISNSNLLAKKIECGITYCNKMQGVCLEVSGWSCEDKAVEDLQSNWNVGEGILSIIVVRFISLDR
jgi:hypothetical protein